MMSSDIEELQKMKQIGEDLEKHFMSPDMREIKKVIRQREIDEID